MDTPTRSRRFPRERVRVALDVPRETAASVNALLKDCNFYVVANTDSMLRFPETRLCPQCFTVVGVRHADERATVSCKHMTCGLCNLHFCGYCMSRSPDGGINWPAQCGSQAGDMYRLCNAPVVGFQEVVPTPGAPKPLMSDYIRVPTPEEVNAKRQQWLAGKK